MITLVLIPGMGGTGIFFEDFAAALQPHFKPVIVRVPNDPSLGYAGREPLARAALPRDGPFLILGESRSGPIAIPICRLPSARVLGLILDVGFARNPRRICFSKLFRKRHEPHAGFRSQPNPNFEVK
jgi:pimeloyl-[acyl-carrier protein] methyl ester esterase